MIYGRDPCGMLRSLPTESGTDRQHTVLTVYVLSGVQMQVTPSTSTPDSKLVQAIKIRNYKPRGICKVESTEER
jgi:hypothetical protein